VRLVALLSIVLACACAPGRPASTPERSTWENEEPPSHKTLRVGELALATGLAASGFGGISMGVGKAVGDQGGEVTFFIGVGALGMGVVSTAIALVLFGVAGVQYASGN
jgi:hypothetical protein